MTKSDKVITGSAIDPDEVKPELDAAWFDEADAFVGNTAVRRGRPPIENPKKAVSLRLDSDVVEWFRRGGDGWQTRINAELRKAAGL